MVELATTAQPLAPRRSPPPVFVDDLRKSYGGVQALRGVTFHVERGETYALLGPNGAGKTTTIEILEGYRRRDGGRAAVLGMDPGSGGRRFRERIGIVLQSTALEPELTVRETAQAFARLYPEPLAVELTLDLVDLGHVAGKPVKVLSGGQKRRLDLALGIIGNPEVLFLDEPTTGLDPEARRKIWSLIGRLTTSGKTILLSSHHMDEVTTLADRLAILVGGVICAEGTPAELQDAFGGKSEIRFTLGTSELPNSYPRPLRQVTQFRRGWIEIRVDNPTPILADLTHWAFRQRISLQHLTVTRPSLEDIYLDLVRAADSAHAGGAAP